MGLSYDSPMTTAEKWREVAQRVVGGAYFTGAVLDVFDESAEALLGERYTLDGWALPLESDTDYDTHYVILCEFLALEAEDDLWAVETPEPVTMVAEEPIVGTFWEDAQDIRMVSVTGYSNERRIPWNDRIADGLRKWADWMEARF